MKRENSRWAPLRWSPGKVRLYTRDVKRVALLTCTDMLGVYDGALAGAELLARMNEIFSLAVLHRRGIKTIGDGGANDSQSQT